MASLSPSVPYTRRSPRWGCDGSGPAGRRSIGTRRSGGVPGRLSRLLRERRNSQCQRRLPDVL